MKKSDKSIDQRVHDWIARNKGLSFSVFFGFVFIIMNVMERSGPLIVLMETVQIVILFVGIMIFVYNFGYVVIMLNVDEGLNDEEKDILKWLVRRAVFISVVWFFGVLALLIIFQHEPFYLASSNCFLLAFLFYFIRKGENPLTEGTFV
ncbi:MAG: hypothetical protein ACTSPG_06855 [Candidatus Hodarchaeales archaeon]